MSEEQTLTYTSERAQQLADNYARVMARVRDAEADTSGVRTEHSPTVRLVTVTKFFPASDVAALYTQGYVFLVRTVIKRRLLKLVLFEPSKNLTTPLTGRLLGSCKQIRQSPS